MIERVRPGERDNPDAPTARREPRRPDGHPLDDPQIMAVEDGFVRASRPVDTSAEPEAHHAVDTLARALQAVCDRDEGADAALAYVVDRLFADPSPACVGWAHACWRAWLDPRISRFEDRLTEADPPDRTDGEPPTASSPPAEPTQRSDRPPPLADPGPLRLTEGLVPDLAAWSARLAADPALRHLADALGRLIAATRTQAAGASSQHPRNTQALPHVSDPGGVQTGGPLASTLPAELVHLPRRGSGAWSGRSAIFWERFAENKLLCWEPSPPPDPEPSPPPAPAAPGPVVLCLDTSGSMAGEPEALAKALLLAVVSAVGTPGSHRACRVILFGSSHEQVELDPIAEPERLIPLLGHAFHGGTDPEPALDRALEWVTETPGADVLMLTDGAFDLGDGLRGRLHAAEAAGVRLHLVLTGPGALDVEDPLWGGRVWSGMAGLARLIREGLAAR